MSSFMKIARPYANAIFSLARETKRYNDWKSLLSFLSRIVCDNDVYLFIKNPTISKNVKTSFLISLLPGFIDKHIGRKLIEYLVEQNRLLIIPFINYFYKRHMFFFEGVVRVFVTTTIPQTEKFKGLLYKYLVSRFGEKVVVYDFGVNYNFVGGVSIKTPTSIIDATFRGNFNRLHEFFSII